MDITQTKFTIKNAPPRKSILIEGDHGLGKSQVVAQCAQELSLETGKPHVIIDIRLAQREAGDVIGYPRGVDSMVAKLPCFINGKRTFIEAEARKAMVHDLPIWFPVDPGLLGFLFFDEMHYAPKDTLQTVFEICLDYRLNGINLPEGIRVIGAGNHMQDKYGGTTLNPALYSRFLKILFKPTVPEWLTWARANNVHPAIVQYVSAVTADLDPPESYEPGTIVPDRRSWVSLSEWIQFQAAKGTDPMKNLDYLLLLSKGYIGDSVGVNFIEYVKKNYKVLSVEDILNKMSTEHVEFLKTLETAELGYYCDGIVAHCKKAGKKLSKKQAENLATFYVSIPKEAASGFWMNFCKEAREAAIDWYNDTKVTLGDGTVTTIKDYTYNSLNKAKALA